MPFRTHEKQGLLWLTSESLALPGVVHGFSTRRGGVSTGMFASLNIGLHNGEKAENVAQNLQILADAFFVPGILMSLLAGMLYVSGEGALIGIGFVMRNVVLAFIPMGRTKHEVYADYRARKLKEAKPRGERCILVSGLVFLFIGIALSVIWSVKFYNA